MTERYIGAEREGGSHYLTPATYVVTCECLRCGHEYSYKAKTIPKKDRPCPRKACREAVIEADIERRAANLAEILESRRAPGVIGDKPIVRAIDTTAEIVMQDNGLTDLKTNLREGDTMAPKLPPRQQAAADNMFDPKAAMAAYREDRGGGRVASQLNRMVRSGALSRNAVSAKTINAGRTPGQKALTMVGASKNPGYTGG